MSSWLEKAAGEPCLMCGAPVPEGRCRGSARRSLYCCDACQASRRHAGRALAPRPQELELLDRGVACRLPRCLELADGWLAGSGPWSGPYCFDCLELVLDRLEALAIAPGMAATLPPLTSRGRRAAVC